MDGNLASSQSFNSSELATSTIFEKAGMLPILSALLGLYVGFSVTSVPSGDSLVSNSVTARMEEPYMFR